MHLKYGRIVRVSPDELHVDDPSFLPELMPSGGRRRHKHGRLMQVFGFSEGAGATVDHGMHRIRRGAMAKMFSKESMRGLEPHISTSMQKLWSRFDEFRTSGQPLDLLPAFAALTVRLIC